MIFSRAGLSVFSTSAKLLAPFKLMTASDGDTTRRSMMKSPRCDSSSSPTGVSSEMGSCAMRKTLRTWVHRHFHFDGELFRSRFAS